MDLEGREQINLANLTLPAVPTSVVIGGLIPGTSYSIRAAAWTSAGLGPASPATTFLMTPPASVPRGAEPPPPLGRPRSLPSPAKSPSDSGVADPYDPFDAPPHGITSDVTQVTFFRPIPLQDLV